MAKCSKTPSIWVEVHVEGMCPSHKKLLQSLVDSYLSMAFTAFDRMTGFELSAVWNEIEERLEHPEAKGTH